MKIFKRLFGICETPAPSREACWSHAAGVVTIDLTQAPELGAAGGAVRLEGRGLPVRVLVVHGVAGGYHAYENRCTHMGRRLDSVSGADQTGRIECCSVSKSTFEYDGAVISGAAKAPIKTLPVSRQGHRLLIRVRN